LLADQFGHQFRQSKISALSPAVFDPNVPAVYISDFL
jgi:hypothetical protein